MHILDTHTLSSTYRLLHLVGMAVLLGGAIHVAAQSVARASEECDGLLVAAARYEWLFWPVVALQVLTGIGNVGVKGSAVPGPATPWGTFFTIKLILVLLALALSLVRTGLVVELSGTPAPLVRRGAKLVQLAYVGTAAVLGAIVLIAVRLAHG